MGPRQAGVRGQGAHVQIHTGERGVIDVNTGVRYKEICKAGEEDEGKLSEGERREAAEAAARTAEEAERAASEALAVADAVLQGAAARAGVEAPPAGPNLPPGQSRAYRQVRRVSSE